MNDMYREQDLKVMPEWHTYSSAEAPWEEGKALRMRGDFKANANCAQRLPEEVRFKRWFNQDPKNSNYRSHAEFEVIKGTAQYTRGELFLVPRMKAFLAYYVPVAF